MADNYGEKRDADAEPMAHVAFHGVMNGAVYAKINPLGCIHFLRIRSTSKFEVLRFVFDFLGLGASKLEPSVGGLACVSNSAIVIALDHDQRQPVQTYFEGKRLSGAELGNKVSSMLLWYVIVNGNYRYQAI